MGRAFQFRVRMIIVVLTLKREVSLMNSKKKVFLKRQFNVNSE